MNRASGGDFRKLFFACVALALKYRWLILAICALALAIGFIQAFISTPIYQATVTIQSTGKRLRSSNLTCRKTTLVTVGIVSTRPQYDLLKSRSLAERVAKISTLPEPRTSLIRHRPRRGQTLNGKIFPSANIAPEDKGNFGRKEPQQRA